jgi:hypothetical protein
MTKYNLTKVGRPDSVIKSIFAENIDAAIEYFKKEIFIVIYDPNNKKKCNVFEEQQEKSINTTDLAF